MTVPHSPRAFGFILSKELFLSVVLAALVLMGCESAVGPDQPNASVTTIEGRVDDEKASAGKRSDTAVQGAAVTAFALNANGELEPLEGKTTVDASGRYKLTVEGELPEEVVIVRAKQEGFSAQTLVYAVATEGAAVKAMPMSAETSLEADVYQQMRRNGKNGPERAAEVAQVVTAEVASDAAAGETTAAEIAQGLTVAAEARTNYLQENSPGFNSSMWAAAGRQKVQAFARLQNQVAQANSSKERQEASVQLEQAVAAAYTKADVSKETAVKAELVGYAAFAAYSNVSEEGSLGLLKQTAHLKAKALARGLKAAFEGGQVSSARFETIQTEAQTLSAALKQAATVEAVQAAVAAFKTTVKAELAAELGVSEDKLQQAEDALVQAKASLQAALADVSVLPGRLTVRLQTAAKEAALAHQQFFVNASETVRTKLEGLSTSQAKLGTAVLVLLNAQ